MDIIYYDGLKEKGAEDINIGDPVEVIVKSPLYCGDGERPEYHFGIVTDIEYEDFADGTYPIGIWVKFDKDDLYEQDEEDQVLFGDIEYILKRKYSIVGYAKRQEFMEISVKGAGIISYEYRNGSLIPTTIKTSSGKRDITDDDRPLLREISKYGSVNSFTHYVFMGDSESEGEK